MPNQSVIFYKYFNAKAFFIESQSFAFKRNTHCEKTLKNALIHYFLRLNAITFDLADELVAMGFRMRIIKGELNYFDRTECTETC